MTPTLPVRGSDTFIKSISYTPKVSLTIGHSGNLRELGQREQP